MLTKLTLIGVATISLALLLIGALALIFPAKSSEMFGIKANSTESISFVRAMGARDIGFGVLGAFFLFQLPLASSVWFTAVVALFSGCDGLITYFAGAKTFKFHFISTFLLIAFSIFILIGGYSHD